MAENIIEALEYLRDYDGADSFFYQQVIDHICFLQSENDDMNAKTKQYKEEVEALKKENERLGKALRNAHSRGGDIAREKIKLEKENAEQKAEIERLKSYIKACECGEAYWVKLLIEDRDKLQSIIDEMRACIQEIIDKYRGIE